MRRVAFKTLGCRLNQAETARIRATFENSSYSMVRFGEPADVCVIHTCAVTAAAENECIRLARGIRRRCPDTFVILAGCAAAVSGPRILSESGAHMLAGHDEKYKLPELLASLHPPPAILQSASTSGHPPACLHASPSPSHLSLTPRFDTKRACVKAQDGCSFGCAYCIVPLSRGPSRSRPRSEVVDEVMMLADHGYREVVLTGANLGCYGDGTTRLVDLVADLERVPSIRRIRLSSIEISTTECDVIDYMATSEKLVHFLHIPLQTGDDRLLSAMGRKYTSCDYRQRIDAILERMPFAGIGTDLITGLPGEDERAFGQTLALVRDIPFGNLHVFPYSIRAQTRAAAMPGHVPRHVAKERAETLIAMGREKQKDFASRFVGRSVEVLIEHVDADGTGTGWTREYVKARAQRVGLKTNDIITLIPSRCESAVLS